MTFHPSYFQSLHNISPREAKILALLHNQQFVTYDQLVEEIWPTNPPRRPRIQLSGYVSWLRKEGYLIGNTSAKGGGGYYLAEEQRQAALKKWLDQQAQV